MITYCDACGVKLTGGYKGHSRFSGVEYPVETDGGETLHTEKRCRDVLRTRLQETETALEKVGKLLRTIRIYEKSVRADEAIAIVEAIIGKKV